MDIAMTNLSEDVFDKPFAVRAMNPIDTIIPVQPGQNGQRCTPKYTHAVMIAHGLAALMAICLDTYLPSLSDNRLLLLWLAAILVSTSLLLLHSYTALS